MKTKINWTELISVLAMVTGAAATVVGNITDKKTMNKTIAEEVAKQLKK